MNIKKIITIFAILITLIFTALAIKNKEKTADELVFWTLQMRDFSPYITKVISNFENENPNVKIKWVDIPFSEGEKRTLASILSDNPPDLVNLNPDFSTLLAQKGTLTEISDMDLTQFPKSIVDGMKYNGKNYFIPWYATSALTFYNKNEIAKLGLKTPQTYDEVLEICHNGFASKDKYLLMFNFSENDSMLKLLNKYGINSAENIASEEAIELFKRLKEAYKIGCFPKESITQSHREALEKFMAGEVLLFEGGSNFLNLIKENAPKTFVQTALSHQLTSQNGKYNFSMMNFIIPIKSKKQAEALKFALYLTNEENQLELGKLTNILATNENALNNEFYSQTGDIFAQARAISAKQLKNIQPIPFYPNRKDVILLINNTTQKIFLEQDSVENALNKLRSELLRMN